MTAEMKFEQVLKESLNMEKQTPIMLYAWLASLKKWTGKLVVKKKYMVWTGCLLLVLSAAWNAVAVYESAREGKVVFRLQAEEALRDMGRVVVMERFDSLQVPFIFNGGGDRKVYKVRALQTERGNFEVKIDSLKEKQSLYPLGSAAGWEAFFLLETSAFPLDKLQKEWQGRLREMDASSYLVLRHTPLGTDSVRVDSLGDASIARPDNELGRYYLDDMYTSMLTAYARADFWKCVEWESPRVWVAFLFFLSAGALGLVVMFRGRRQPSPASLPVSEEEPVWSIGRWVYHKDTMKLTCEGEKVDIQPQPLKLFCAFMQHGGYLSYADINEALGWHESSLGLDSRRKRAISTLRTVLREKDARIQIKHEEEGYRISVTD